MAQNVASYRVNVLDLQSELVGHLLNFRRRERRRSRDHKSVGFRPNLLYLALGQTDEATGSPKARAKKGEGLEVAAALAGGGERFRGWHSGYPELEGADGQPGVRGGGVVAHSRHQIGQSLPHFIGNSRQFFALRHSGGHRLGLGRAQRHISGRKTQRARF